MKMSDKIETFLIELLKNEGNRVEVGRNELASIFDCVPSQINYVISTRFSPQRGYIVDSKRGGGGCLVIQKISVVDAIMDAISLIGDSIDFETAKSLLKSLCKNDVISEDRAVLMLTGISDKSLAAAGDIKNKVRADSLKNMLLV